MAIVKQLNTRIALKYDSYSNWINGEGKNLVLLKGEIGICEIPSDFTANGDSRVMPTVLFKVGDGSKKFSELPWASAKAADVYSWAKASEVKLDGKKLVFVGGKPDGSNLEITFDYATSGDVSDLTTRVAAIEGSIGTGGTVATDIADLKERMGDAEEALEVINGEAAGSIKKAEADAKAYAKDYTDGREVEIKKYVDQAEQDAKDYSDGELSKAVGTLNAKDSELAGKISANTTLINNEVSAREQAINEINGKLDVAKVSTAIAAAKSEAISDANTYTDNKVKTLADGAVAQNTTKIGENTTAIAEVAGNLAKEVTDRGTAITNATNSITSAYQAADLAINNKIGTVAEGKTVVGLIGEAQAAAEQKVTNLENGQVKTNKEAIAENKAAIAAEKSRAEGVEAGFEERISAMEVFWDTTEDSDNVVNKLKEIQDYIANDTTGAAGMLESIQANTQSINNLNKEFADNGRVTAAEDAIDELETEVASIDGRVDVLEGTVAGYNATNTVKKAIDAVSALAEQGISDAAEAKSYVDTREAAIKVAYEAYADKSEADAVASAKSYTDGVKSTLEAEDARLAGLIGGNTENIGKNAQAISAMDTAYKAAVSGEETARKNADAAIEAKIGGSYNSTNTVAKAIEGVSVVAEQNKVDLAALTGRVSTNEGAIADIKAIVSTGNDSNAKLRSAITDLQTLTGTSGAIRQEIAAAKKAGDDAAAAVVALTNGQVKTNKEGIADLVTRVSAIEGDYLQAADEFILQCGTSTTVVHVKN